MHSSCKRSLGKLVRQHFKDKLEMKIQQTFVIWHNHIYGGKKIKIKKKKNIAKGVSQKFHDALLKV